MDERIYRSGGIYNSRSEAGAWFRKRLGKTQKRRGLGKLRLLYKIIV